MEPERWHKVKEIFQDAQEQDPGEREAFVRSACGDDQELRRDVMSLLDSAQAAESFIEAPLFERAAERPEEPPDRDEIGPYRLLRQLGRGGMGVVYLAERSDEEFEQRVAIKLIKRGMDTDEVLSRFRHERQILANLVHPHVARLLDGGTTEDGRPYFVMEYVEGQPLGSYCAERGLATSERLELFRKVCSAVQFAHQNLVVHRDLKPANILVTADGEPKLLDFGIAKLLSPEGGQITRLAGSRPLTPEYASPEQLQGKAVTTVSDVFSLGVLLYELLTGIQPSYGGRAKEGESWPGNRPEPPSKPSAAVRDWSKTEPAEIEVRVPQPGSPPPRPAAARRELRRRLAGDLDHIVLKAMRYEARDRYSSVEQLADDVARHLDGRPVLARRGSWFYGSRKLVQRYWIQLTAFVALAALVGSLGFIEMQARRAEREYGRAEAMGDFLLQLISGASPEKGITLRELLDRGAEGVFKHLADQPEDQAGLLGRIGQTYRQIGQLDKAQELLEEALRIRRELHGEDHPLITRNLNSLALVSRDLEDFVAAEELMREVLAIERRLRGPEHPYIAAALHNHAGTLKALGRFEEAVEEYREALAMKRRLPETRDDEESIATGLNALGAGLHAAGQLEEAETILGQALEMRLRLFEPDSALVAIVLNNLALVRRDQKKRLEEAERMLRQSLEIRRRAFDEKRSQVAKALRNLAICVQMRGGYEEAREFYSEALEIERQEPTGRHLSRAATLRELATLQMAQGDYATAETRAREAVEILRAGLPEGHWRIADAESVLGAALVGLGRRDEGEPLLRRGYEGVIAVKSEEARESREARERLEALESSAGTQLKDGGQ